MMENMKDLGSIHIHAKPLSKHEWHELNDAIADIRRPYEQLILNHCATRLPTIIIHKDGLIENEWDVATQSFIERVNGYMLEAVRLYLRTRGY